MTQISRLDGIIAYREPHFWMQSEDNIVGSLHVQVKENADEQHILNLVNSYFKEKGHGGLHVAHLCIQIEKEKFVKQLTPEKRSAYHENPMTSLPITENGRKL